MLEDILSSDGCLKDLKTKQTNYNKKQTNKTKSPTTTEKFPNLYE